MKRQRLYLFLILILIFYPILRIFPQQSQGPQNFTTIIMVRHTEKVLDGSNDPPLTLEGKKRAKELAYILKHIPLNSIYSTPYERTLQTIRPTAEEKNLPINRYNPGQEEEFLARVLKNHVGEFVLIVGHSNTIPRMSNVLAGKNTFPDLEDNIYDNLFIATTRSLGKATIIRLRFGSHTPK